MSTIDTIQPTPLPTTRPGGVSQATAVEQARAEAEVKAAVVVAQQCPRSVQNALSMMEDACSQPALANRAFFSFRRGGSNVAGPSIHLAREVARCWGNVDYGIRELRRDDAAGESEMLAFAWDLQTNVRASSSFIVPHVRFAKGQRNPLDDPRDVYENNANQGARRVREAIFAVLPKWYTEAAEERCHATLKDGGGKPLAQRISTALALFGELKISEDMLAARIGKRSSDWSPTDVAGLTVLYTSLQRGETTVGEQFSEPVEPLAPVVSASDVMSTEEPTA